jgi:hypothetical protein
MSRMRQTWVPARECTIEGCHSICMCVVKAHSVFHHSVHSVTDKKQKLQYHGQYSDEAMGWRIKESGLFSYRDKRFFFSPKHSDLLCSPTILLFSGYRGIFPME